MEAAGVISCAFGLGYVLQSAHSAIPDVVRNCNGSSGGAIGLKGVVRSPRRITLLAFFTSVTIWSTLQFVLLLLLDDSSCKVSSIFVAIFDQLSRILIFGVALCGVRKSVDNGAEKGVLVITVILRVVLGVVVVSFTRHTFIPVCFLQADPILRHSRSAGITQLCFDGVMSLIMLVRAWVAWRDAAERHGSSGNRMGMGLFLVVLSLGGWNLAAATFVLRVGSIFVRLAPTIFTLAILIGLIRIFPDIFFFLSEIDHDRENQFPGRMIRLGSDSSAVHSRGGRSYAYPTGADIEGSMAKNGPHITYEDPNGHRRTNSSVFRNIIGQPIVHPGTMVSWSLEQEESKKHRRNASHNYSGTTAAALAATEAKSGLVETKFPAHAGGMTNISGPILKNGGFGPADDIPGGDRQEPFKNMRTVSLHTAAEVERARIDAQFEREEESRRMDLQSMGHAGPSRSMRIETATTTPRTIASFAGLPTPDIGSSQLSIRRNPITAMPHISAINPQHHRQASGLGISERDPVSPQTQSGYRMSTNTFFTEDDTTRYTQSHAGFALGPPPLPVARSDPNSQRSVGDQRVLFLKDIEYDDPALVHSLMNQKPTIDTARSTGRYTRSYRGVLRRSPPARTTDMKLSAPRENSDESPVLPNGVPVMQRMRSIKRESSRALFPSESRTPEDDRKALRKFSTVSQKMNLASPAPPPTEPLPEPPIPRMPIEHLPIMETLPLVLESKATFPIAESFKVPNAEPPLIPEKSENRLSIQSQNSSESSATDPGDVMYETAKAWVASVAPIHQKAAVPMLVNVSLSRMGSLARRESSASVNNSRSRNSSIEEEKIMGNAEIITLGSSEEVTDRYRDSAIIRKSGITFLASPVLEENEDEEQEAKIGGLVFRRKSYESMNLSDPGFDEVVSLSPDNGYSTNEEENDNDQGDYFSGSSQISIDDNDDVIISDFEDALEFERMHIAKRNLDSKFQDLMNGVSNFDALIMPRHFKLGDRIPNFYSARGNQGYGQKRKSPPVPLGMVPLRPIFTNSFTKGRQSQVQPSSTAINKPSNKSSSAASTTSSESIQPGIQARLTQLMGKHQRPEPLEELIRRLPVEKKQKAQEDHRTSALSDGRGSLIRQLESEVSQQETQWKGMRKSMRHDSLNSSVSSTLDTLASESTSTSERHSQRRSFIAKLSSGIDRRLSTVQTSATTATTATNTSRLSAVDWQRQSAEAKMVYLAEASQLTNRVREDLRLKSDVTMMGTFAGSNLSLSPFPTPLAARAMEIDPCTISNVNLSQRASPKIYTPSEEVELSVMGASTKAYKPQSKMWSAPLVEVEIPRLQVACLWKGGQRAVVPNAVPAAINVRSRKRFDKEQPIVKSSQLWKKSREMPRSANTSLWKNPKDFRPRSIMSHHRRTSSMKRVTFVEEVITVEPTGIMGRLKKLWGGKSSIKKAQSITEVPPPLPSLSQLRTLNRTPISGILDSITKKYEKKALPQLPPKKSLQPQTVFAGKLWVKKRSSGEVAHTHLWPSSLPLCKTFYAEWKRNTRTDNTPVANFLSISGLWGTKMQMHTQPSKKMNVLWPLGTIEQSYSGKGSWRPQNTPQSISRTNLTIDINVIRPVKVAGLTKTIAVHVNKAEASPTGLWLLTQQQKTPITGLLSTQHLNDGMSSVRSSICFEESTIVSAKMVQWTRPSRASVIIDFPVSERKNDVPNLPDRAVSGLWRKRKEVPNGPPCAAAALTSLWERGASRPQHSPQKFSELVGNTQRPYAKSTAQYIDLAVVGGSLWTKTNDPEIDRSHKHANCMWVDERAGKSQHGSLDIIPINLLPPAQHPQQSNTRLWSSSQNSKSSCMTMTAAAPVPQLWTSSSSDTKDLFASSLPSPTRPKQQLISDPPAASGSLWQRPRSDSKPEQPRLWKPAGTKGLWTHDGETVTLADIEAAKREVVLLWSQSRAAPSLFANQPVDTLRSKRDVSTKTLPKVEEGLWRKKIEEEIEEDEKDGQQQRVLWSGISTPPKQDVNEELEEPKTNTAMASMWSKDNDNVPDLFAKLSTDSCVRSKKDHSTETLPVFSEELWKTAVPLPTQPSLWAPIVKPTGLWNAPTYNAITTPISLQQIALERKKAQKLLWSRKTARRTTEAEPERTKVAIRQLDLPLVVVSGSLWNKAKPAADIGLWKRRVRSKTVASDTIPPAVPLWAKETARRTTKLAPERGVAVKKISNITLSVVSGSLWTKKEEKDEEPSLWNKSLNSPETPPQLWSQDTVIRTQVPKKPEFERIENILPLDSTSLWVPPSPEPHKSLWKPQQMPPTPTESPSNEESSPAPLWTKSTARRQTDKVPQRVAPAPRKSSVVLEKASGTMWGQQDEPLSPMSMGGLSRASTISTASTVSASEEVLDDIPVHVRAAHSTKNSISSVLGSVAPPTITKVGLWAPASPQEKEKSRA